MKKKLIYLLQLLSTLAIFYLLFSRWSISLPEISNIFVQPVWLILCIYFSIVLIPVLAAFRWKVLLTAVDINIQLKELIKINFTSIFWGTFLPSSDGFAAIRIYKIEKRLKLESGKAGSTVIAEKILGFLCLCLTAFLFSLFWESIPNISQIRFVIIVLIIFVLLVLYLIFNKRFNEFLPHLKPKTIILKKILQFIGNMHKTLRKLPVKFIFFTAFPLIIIIQFITFINVFLLFKTAEINISIWNVLAVVPIIQLISLIPVTLSGLGIREGAFVYFFGLLGVPVEIAFAVSILNFLILNGIPALIGGILNLRSQILSTGKLK